MYTASRGKQMQAGPAVGRHEKVPAAMRLLLALMFASLCVGGAAAQIFAPAAYPALYQGDFDVTEDEVRAAVAAAEAKLGPDAAEVGIKLSRLAYTIVRWDTTPWHQPPSKRRGV